MRSFWLNAQKGRATVRNRALRRARWIHDDIAKLRQSPNDEDALIAFACRYGVPSDMMWRADNIERWMVMRMQGQVRTARSAHQDWRRYRRYVAEQRARLAETPEA